MFEIVERDGRFRVLRNGELQNARFHRREQAEAYVATQEQAVRDEYRARKGHLLAGKQLNFYDPELNLLSYPPGYLKPLRRESA
jgi:hypothetical protein